MDRSRDRRTKSLRDIKVDEYRRQIRTAVQGFYGTLPAGPGAPPVNARLVSRFEKDGFRIENVLFDSFTRWEVNATVHVPTQFAPPFPVVIVAVGHSGKQYASYQLTCQYFARCGFLAITFDPPGQASEKRPGNDHFVDGVRSYLVGQTSSRYFIADALRCVDYAASRPDADLRNGIALTGVSGGGTTTTFAGLIDDRITVLGPSCCVTPLADLDITQCYAGCPETHMFGRYAEGIDEVDLLCAAFPKATLLMAGEKDEVFHIEDTRRLADEVRAFYQAAGCPEQFELYVDPGDHCYSLAQAEKFAWFMNRWLRREPDRAVPKPGKPDMYPYDECRCYPRTDVNIRTITLDRARELEATRNGDATCIIASAKKLTGPANTSPTAVTGEPFQVWAQYWQSVVIRTEPDIELPATFLYPVNGPAPAVLHFDDRNRNALLYRYGPLSQVIQFTELDRPSYGLLSVDLRGWGDSAPIMYPYDMAGWGGTDRSIAYGTAALADPVMAMRIRDGLSALAYLRTRKEIDANRIVVSGAGLGGIVALHVAAIDGNLRGVAIWECLASFMELLETERYTWPADAFFPNVLCHYDLPDLARTIPCPVHVINPRDGTGSLLSADKAEKLYGSDVRILRTVENETDRHGAIADALTRLLQ